MRLGDIRVLDFCWVGAGAFVTRLLADMGAMSSRSNRTRIPDNLRLSGRTKPVPSIWKVPAISPRATPTRRGIAITWADPEARAIAKRLAAKCSCHQQFPTGIMDAGGWATRIFRRSIRR